MAETSPYVLAVAVHEQVLQLFFSRPAAMDVLNHLVKVHRSSMVASRTWCSLCIQAVDR